MKIHGKKLERPPFEVVVIPRREGDIVIKAKPVLNYEDFEKLCPAPVPPIVTRPGGDEGVKSVNTQDARYLASVSKWAHQRIDWMIMTSLSATEGLEFENVRIDDPESWGKIHDELTSSGFSSIEVSKIIDTVMVACGLNQDKIDQATSNFLVSRAAEQAKG